jgi:predicted DNA-binding transcriptional regulator AlpA
MVTAKEIVARTGIPRTTLYRLIDANLIPAHSASKPWHQRRRFVFCLAEVEAALKMIRPE